MKQKKPHLASGAAPTENFVPSQQLASIFAHFNNVDQPTSVQTAALPVKSSSAILILRKLTKRSDATRLKAIAEFKAFVDGLQKESAADATASNDGSVTRPTSGMQATEGADLVAEVLAFLPEFCRVYRAIVLLDRLPVVRRVLNEFLGIFCRIVGRKISVFLKTILPVWWLSCSDTAVDVAAAAQHAISIIFPTEAKVIRALDLFCDGIMEEILRLASMSETSFWLDVHGENYKNVPLSVREELYDHVQAASVTAFSRLYVKLPQSERLLELCQPLFDIESPGCILRFLGSSRGGAKAPCRALLKRSTIQAFTEILNVRSSISLKYRGPGPSQGSEASQAAEEKAFSKKPLKDDSAIKGLVTSSMYLFQEGQFPLETNNLISAVFLNYPDASIRLERIAATFFSTTLLRLRVAPMSMAPSLTALVAAVPSDCLLSTTGMEFLQLLFPTVLLSISFFLDFAYYLPIEVLRLNEAEAAELRPGDDEVAMSRESSSAASLNYHDSSAAAINPRKLAGTQQFSDARPTQSAAMASRLTSAQGAVGAILTAYSTTIVFVLVKRLLLAENNPDAASLTSLLIQRYLWKPLEIYATGLTSENDIAELVPWSFFPSASLQGSWSQCKKQILIDCTAHAPLCIPVEIAKPVVPNLLVATLRQLYDRDLRLARACDDVRAILEQAAQRLAGSFNNPPEKIVGFVELLLAVIINSHRPTLKIDTAPASDGRILESQCAFHDNPAMISKNILQTFLETYCAALNANCSAIVANVNEYLSRMEKSTIHESVAASRSTNLPEFNSAMSEGRIVAGTPEFLDEEKWQTNVAKLHVLLNVGLAIVRALHELVSGSCLQRFRSSISRTNEESAPIDSSAQTYVGELCGVWRSTISGVVDAFLACTQLTHYRKVHESQDTVDLLISSIPQFLKVIKHFLFVAPLEKEIYTTEVEARDLAYDPTSIYIMQKVQSLFENFLLIKSIQGEALDISHPRWATGLVAALNGIKLVILIGDDEDVAVNLICPILMHLPAFKLVTALDAQAGNLCCGGLLETLAIVMNAVLRSEGSGNTKKLSKEGDSVIHYHSLNCSEDAAHSMVSRKGPFCQCSFLAILCRQFANAYLSCFMIPNSGTCEALNECDYVEKVQKAYLESAPSIAAFLRDNLKLTELLTFFLSNLVRVKGFRNASRNCFCNAGLQMADSIFWMIAQLALNLQVLLRPMLGFDPSLIQSFWTVFSDTSLSFINVLSAENTCSSFFLDSLVYHLFEPFEEPSWDAWRHFASMFHNWLNRKRLRALDAPAVAFFGLNEEVWEPLVPIFRCRLLRSDGQHSLWKDDNSSFLLFCAKLIVYLLTAADAKAHYAELKSNQHGTNASSVPEVEVTGNGGIQSSPLIVGIHQTGTFSPSVSEARDAAILTAVILFLAKKLENQADVAMRCSTPNFTSFVTQYYLPYLLTGDVLSLTDVIRMASELLFEWSDDCELPENSVLFQLPGLLMEFLELALAVVSLDKEKRETSFKITTNTSLCFPASNTIERRYLLLCALRSHIFPCSLAGLSLIDALIQLVNSSVGRHFADVHDEVANASCPGKANSTGDAVSKALPANASRILAEVVFNFLVCPLHDSTHAEGASPQNSDFITGLIKLKSLRVCLMQHLDSFSDITMQDIAILPLISLIGRLVSSQIDEAHSSACHSVMDNDKELGSMPEERSNQLLQPGTDEQVDDPAAKLSARCFDLSAMISFRVLVKALAALATMGETTVFVSSSDFSERAFLVYVSRLGSLCDYVVLSPKLHLVSQPEVISALMTECLSFLQSFCAVIMLASDFALEVAFHWIIKFMDLLECLEINKAEILLSEEFDYFMTSSLSQICRLFTICDSWQSADRTIALPRNPREAYRKILNSVGTRLLRNLFTVETTKVHNFDALGEMNNDLCFSVNNDPSSRSGRELLNYLLKGYLGAQNIEWRALLAEFLAVLNAPFMWLPQFILEDNFKIRTWMQQCQASTANQGCDVKAGGGFDDEGEIRGTLGDQMYRTIEKYAHEVLDAVPDEESRPDNTSIDSEFQCHCGCSAMKLFLSLILGQEFTEILLRTDSVFSSMVVPAGQHQEWQCGPLEFSTVVTTLEAWHLLLSSIVGHRFGTADVFGVAKLIDPVALFEQPFFACLCAQLPNESSQRTAEIKKAAKQFNGKILTAATSCFTRNRQGIDNHSSSETWSSFHETQEAEKINRALFDSLLDLCSLLLIEPEAALSTVCKESDDGSQLPEKLEKLKKIDSSFLEAYSLLASSASFCQNSFHPPLSELALKNPALSRYVAVCTESSLPRKSCGGDTVDCGTVCEFTSQAGGAIAPNRKNRTALSAGFLETYQFVAGLYSAKRESVFVSRNSKEAVNFADNDLTATIIKLLAAKIFIFLGTLSPKFIRSWYETRRGVHLREAKTRQQFQAIFRNYVSPFLVKQDVAVVSEIVCRLSENEDDPLSATVSQKAKSAASIFDEAEREIITKMRYFSTSKTLHVTVATSATSADFVAFELEFTYPDLYPLVPADVKSVNSGCMHTGRLEKLSRRWVWLAMQSLQGCRAMVKPSWKNTVVSNKPPQEDEKWEDVVRTPNKASIAELMVDNRGCTEEPRNSLQLAISKDSNVFWSAAPPAGSVSAAVYLFRANAQGFLRGLQECPICYNLIGGKNRTSFPTEKCRVCSYVFHKECLDKWFRTSQKQICPLCQTVIL